MRALTDSILIATCCPVSVFFPNRNCPKAPLAIFLPTKYRLATKNSAGEALDWLMAKLRNFRTANIFLQFFLAAISPFSGPPGGDFLLTVSFSTCFSYFLLSLTSTMTAIEEWFDVTDVVCVDLLTIRYNLHDVSQKQREEDLKLLSREGLLSSGKYVRAAAWAKLLPLVYIIIVQLFLMQQMQSNSKVHKCGYLWSLLNRITLSYHAD